MVSVVQARSTQHFVARTRFSSTHTHMFKLIANAEQWNIRFHSATTKTVKSKQFCNSISQNGALFCSLARYRSYLWLATLVTSSCQTNTPYWIRWALSPNQTMHFFLLFPSLFLFLPLSVALSLLSLSPPPSLFLTFDLRVVFMDLRVKLDCIENISRNIWTHASVKLALTLLRPLPFFFLFYFPTKKYPTRKNEHTWFLDSLENRVKKFYPKRNSSRKSI